MFIRIQNICQFSTEMMLRASAGNQISREIEARSRRQLRLRAREEKENIRH